MEKIKYTRFLLVKDNFYKSPEKVYQTALESDFYAPEHATGYRSKKVYHEIGIKEKLETILGIHINRWDTDPLEENGVFYQGFSEGKRKEIPGVHADEPYNDITVVVYLTPGLPYNCGTSLWQHKKSGLMEPMKPKVKKGETFNEDEFLYPFERDSKIRNRWEEIDRVGYRFNRMVAYPSGVFHSATNHYGHAGKNGRIYQTFRIGVDWDSFKLRNV